LELKTILPDSSEISLDANKPTALYTIYNLDKHWRETENLNRVLILEPSHFEAYPVSDKMINFVLGLARNIDGIKIYTGEFSSLVEEYPDMQFIYKEHPFSRHFTGLEDDRDWLNKELKVTGSFFKYWKQVRKNLKQEFENQSKYRLAKA
jgi:deoxyribodipyrimidine photo-lyase